MATQVHDTRFSFPALWLRFVAWIFKLAGGLFAFMALFPLAAIIIRYPPLEGYPPYWIETLALAAMGAVLIGTGVLLSRRSRAGAVLALLVTLYPAAFALAGRRPFDWSDVIVDVVTVAVIASIWPQLTSWSVRPKPAD